MYFKRNLYHSDGTLRQIPATGLTGNIMLSKYACRLRQLLFVFIAVFLAYKSFGQSPDPVAILKKATQKCQSIRNGSYTMHFKIKYMTTKDTAYEKYVCRFRKLPQDTLYHSVFHYKKFTGGRYVKDVLYTGNELVDFSAKDSTGTIFIPGKVNKHVFNPYRYNLYDPVINPDHFPLPNDSAYVDRKHFFRYVGEEKINGKPVYHIQMTVTPEKDTVHPIQITGISYDFRIGKQDYLPVQYSNTYDFVMNNDTMRQYTEYTLSEYKFNLPENNDDFGLSNLPSFLHLGEYKPPKAPELLPPGTYAPDWTLISSDGEKHSLSDYRGHLVLLDFFYKSCYPCMIALPELTSLYEKFKGQGLIILGIDPYSAEEEGDMKTFLAKRGVTYPVFHNGFKVAKKYHVSAYPTMYLIDKNGKIITGKTGYGPDSKEELEQIIRKNL